tara:strand:+ start:675 stop:890 length:216 start_codon:yes stop_codon:yes gene_type:complete
MIDLSKTAQVKGLLLPVDLAVDMDINEQITFGADDETTADDPYEFWINNDRDSDGVKNRDRQYMLTLRLEI